MKRSSYQTHEKKRRFLNSKAVLASLILMNLFLSKCKIRDHFIYYEVGIRTNSKDWKDTSFIVATKNEQIITLAEEELKLPIESRKMITGSLERGSRGYNKNSNYEFQWHFNENKWTLTKVNMELCDGRPFSDVDQHVQYWIRNVKTFCPWRSYIKKRITIKK